MTLADRVVADWYAPRHSALTLALWPVSLAFRAAVAMRRALYRHGILRTVEVGVPVVVVGNITVGGTGKTPLVAHLAGALAQRGYTPGIVSRGYGATSVHIAPLIVGRDDDAARVGDEPLLLARAGFPVAVARDRVAAARALLDAYPSCDMIVADDGLQHYRLARDVEIVVVDGTRALGNGSLLPAGPLREPASRLDDVDAVVVSIGSEGAPPKLGRRSFVLWLEGDVFRRVDDPLIDAPASSFARGNVHALAGIGNPARFFDALQAMGIDAVRHPFPDHHRYVAADLAIDGASAILMTEKDAVKCAMFADARCWSLPVRARVDAALVDLIEEKIRGLQAA